MASMNSSSFARSFSLKGRGFLLRRVISMSMFADIMVVESGIGIGRLF